MSWVRPLEEVRSVDVIDVGGKAAHLGELINAEPAGDIGVAFFVLFLVWYIGRRIRIRGDYLTLLQGRAAQLEREQAAEARRAVAEERTRIARELHDVVAHCKIHARRYARHHYRSTR